MLRLSIAGTLLLALISQSLADDKPTLCWIAKQAREAAGSEKAAEDAARAQGYSEAIIRAAKRCFK